MVKFQTRFIMKGLYVHTSQLIFLFSIGILANRTKSQQLNESLLIDELRAVTDKVRQYIVKSDECYLSTPGSASKLYFDSLLTPESSLVQKILREEKNHNIGHKFSTRRKDDGHFPQIPIFWGTPCFNTHSFGNTLTDYFESIGI